MNRRPNTPKCILGVVMVALMVIGGLATTTTRLAAIARAAKAVATGSPQAVGCGTSLEVDGNPQDSGSVGEDWDTVVGNGTGQIPRPGSVAVVATFVNDTGVNDRIYTGGSTKDFIDTNQWRHTIGSVPDKDEIDDAFAALYNDPSGDRILYFGGDRHAQNGDAQIGFWFFQNAIAPVTSGPLAGTFSGVHANGDLLILSTFTKGGTVPTLQIFKWVGTPGPGFQNCTGGILDNSGTICDITAIANQANALTNSVGVLAPWPYTPKSGPAGTIPPSGFFEGCLNLTDAGLAAECFSTFLLETRSSQSTDAVLKDFALGSFQQCNLQCSKTADASAICEGQSTTYTYTVTNPGGIALTVNVVDDNGTASTADDFSPFNSSGGCGDSPPSTTFTLAASATATCTRTVTLSGTGAHTNTITVTGTAGTTTLECSSSATVTVNPNPTCSISGPTPVCAGSTGNVYTSTATAGSSHSWSITGNGTIIGSTTGASVTVTAGAAGGFTLRDDVTLGTCTSFCTYPVTVNPNPSCSISGPTPVCAGSTGNVYTSTATAGASHSWSITGNGTIVGSTTGSSVTVDAGAAGSFHLTDNISLNGCLSACEYDVTVASNPAVQITATDCGTSITLTANVTGGTGPFSYAWTVPAGVSDPGNVASFGVTVPGGYSVLVTDASSCSGSRAATIGVCLVGTSASSATVPKSRAKRKQ